MSYHSLRTPREAITEIVRHAPPEVRPAIIALIRAAYRSLKRGYQPDVRAVPLRSWRSLLQLLSSVAAMQSDGNTTHHQFFPAAAPMRTRRAGYFPAGSVKLS